MNPSLADNIVVNNVAVWIKMHGYDVTTKHETFEIEGTYGKPDEIDMIFILAPEGSNTQVGTLTLHHGQWEMTIFNQEDVPEMTELASAISSTMKIDITLYNTFENDVAKEDDPRLTENTDGGESLWPTGIVILLILGVFILVFITGQNSF